MFDKLGEDFQCIRGVAASPTRNSLRTEFGVFLWEVRNCKDRIDVYCTNTHDVIFFDMLR